ncbi:serine/threonine-protein kinase [Arenimonas sp.]|uniref:serine/threonine-protein kinase n=1 Tax=Arenimonas sp. TaxID=1872635 RepID=UPI0025B9F80E|nr:serine/threonine-protein kinase [Arenimonas sp.]
MKTSLEIQVLQLFEQALEQPVDQREAWLEAQPVSPAVAERARRLLRAEQAAGDFMEATAVAPEAVPPEFPKVGERLGNYELLKPLEAGGMGVVYLGRRADDVYDQQVAIKLVRPVHLLAAAEFRRKLITRFEDERSILARMSHPNVARILDGGSTAGGIPYLVMEYVDGVSLTDYCKANALDVPARLRLFCKVCDGVQEAHRHLIVHRDLKPDNILVGANGEPRLLDFGIAKILEQEPRPADGNTSLTAMTPAYASPEQVRQEALTTSSDVYSLGVVLYQLIAGVRPYELGGLRPGEAEHVVCDTLPEPMRKMLDKAALPDEERRRRRAQIGQDVERIVAKAMHKEAGRRYGSAQELADDIRRYLSGQPVQAHPDSAGYRLGKFLRRHKVGAALGSTALVAVLVASGIAAWQAREATRAAEDTQAVNAFLLDVLGSSDPYNAGTEITLSQAVDQASAQVGERFAGRPDLSSRIRFSLGYSMLSRYRLDLAERELLLALDESRRAFGDDAVETQRVREAVAQLRKDQQRTEEAETLLKEVIGGLERAGQQADPLYFVTVNNLGQLYLDAEDYPRAREQFERARALLDAGARVPDQPSAPALLTGNLAYVAHGLGELEASDGLYREARTQMQAVFPDGGPELAVLVNNHAYVLDDLGRKDEAYAMKKESLAMRRAAFKGDHPMIVGSAYSLAMDALRREEFAYAESLARDAAAMADRLGAVEMGIMARVALAGTMIQTRDFTAAGEHAAQARERLASLPAPEAYLVANVDKVISELCKRPRTPAVAACAGIEPTEPALP